jgi:uncharacterized membrane protein HdeD (DUF308 family)
MQAGYYRIDLRSLQGGSREARLTPLGAAFSIDYWHTTTPSLKRNAVVNTFVNDIAQSVQDTRKEWGWYLALGIVLIAAGVFAVYSGYAATRASVIVFGAVLLAAGVIQLVTMFGARGAGHVILFLLIGLLDIVVGVMLIEHPDAGALLLTLLLSIAFFFGGLYRFVAANVLQFPHYGWAAFSGIVSTILGVLLWMQWPVSAVWFIGFAVGINLIFAGIAWSTIAWKLKSA